MTMTKNDLIDLLYEQAGLSKKSRLEAGNGILSRQKQKLSRCA